MTDFRSVVATISVALGKYSYKRLKLVLIAALLVVVFGYGRIYCI